MKTDDLDIIVPVSLDPIWQDPETVAEKIRYQYEQNGFVKYALYAPNKGWRSETYPPVEHYTEIAEAFARVKQLLCDIPVQCGWLIYLTIKTGKFSEESCLVRANGTPDPMRNCPTDTQFRTRFLEDIKRFVQIGNPAFLLLEDDYTMSGSCYCKRHLALLEQRVGKAYTREKLRDGIACDNEEGKTLLRIFRQLMGDTVVDFAREMRSVVDEINPEIPFGYCQSAGADYDDDSTEGIIKALAGDKHTPFVRLYGTFYCGTDVKRIPEELHHLLYCRQHIRGDVKFYHESDSYPHNRYFTSGRELKTLIGTACSYGVHGLLLWTGYLLGMERGEGIYGKMVSKEKARLDMVAKTARECRVQGVQVGYHPFGNTAGRSADKMHPEWAQTVGRFGIPYTTEESCVCFWDEAVAKHSSEEEVMKCLSGNLFLDGAAAKCLYERGYGAYLGVNVGEDMADEPMFRYDLAAREVVTTAFLMSGEEPEMPIAHMWCPNGNGQGIWLQINHPDCEEITQIYNFKKQYLCPGMTRFKNALGGCVIVMGLTLENNQSQALFNYMRQNLLRRLVQECDDSLVMVKDAPNVFLITNHAENTESMLGMLTLTNLSVDVLDKVELHIPPVWSGFRKISILNEIGEWEEIPFIRTASTVTLHQKLEYCDPVYVLFHND